MQTCKAKDITYKAIPTPQKGTASYTSDLDNLIIWIKEDRNPTLKDDNA